jgi:4-amino-4-deoxy-L-arabinose transferase-like glycosyltransferase
LILRLIVVFWIPTVPTEDFWSYFQRAIHLLDNGSYDASLGWHEADYPPGYSLFLSLFLWLPFDRLLTAKIVNVLISSAAIFLTSELARNLFGRKVALVAAVLTSLSPRMILQSTLIASENLFIPLLLLWVLLNFYWLDDHRYRKTFITGCLVGALTLTRTVALLLVIPWLISFLPVLRKNIANLVIMVILFLGGQFIVLAPWAVRNYLVLGKATVLTTAGGLDLFMGNNAHATGEWYAWTPDMESIYPDFSQRSVIVKNELAQHEAVKWIMNNPLDALKLYIKKWKIIFRDDMFALDMAIFSKQLWPPSPPSDVLIGPHPLKQYQAQLNKLFNDHYWVILILEISGIFISLFQLWKSKESILIRKWLLIIATAAYFPAFTALVLASTRFHWPATDLLMPFAALTITFIYTQIVTSKLLERVRSNW